MNSEKNIYTVNERALFLDCGRKYFSPTWFERAIPQIKLAGMNTLYLHFSEEMGLRLESKQFPWLAGGDHTLCVHGSKNGSAEDDKKYLSQDELKYILSIAKDCKVNVIPSFDSPGPMNYAVKKYNEHFSSDIGNSFHKDGKVSIVQGSSLPGESAQTRFSRGIDISNPEAVKFVRALLCEYGELFSSLGCKSFDIGGDELLGFGENIDDSYSKWQSLEHWEKMAQNLTDNKDATAYDAFLLYMNDTASLMRSMGYNSIRMWNDDVLRSGDTDWKRVCELDKNIEIEFWVPYANGGANNVFTYLNEGYKVYNFLNYYTYYILGIGMKNNVTPQMIENEWNAYVFDSKENGVYLNPAEHTVLGGAYCIWCDNPSALTADKVLEKALPFIQAAGKKLN